MLRDCCLASKLKKIPLDPPFPKGEVGFSKILKLIQNIVQKYNHRDSFF